MHSDDAGVLQISGSFRAMATSVVVSVCHTPTAAADYHQKALDRVRAVFSETEASCSRFRQSTDLSKLNQSPSDWHSVAPLCFSAISEAYDAYKVTKGLFDPRILRDLTSLGYVNSWTAGLPDSRSNPSSRTRQALNDWKPGFESNGKVRVGEFPIDLGGIGKGLALRWSAKEIEPETPNFLIEAGGDCICSGSGPTGAGWSIGVQNPFQPDGDPLMVLRLSDIAVCTSSTAVRSWWQNGVLRHHIIDPRTGEPGGNGLAAVTVIDNDPALAEVWSKSLFLVGRDSIREFSEIRGVAAVWITDRGEIFRNSLAEPYIIWNSL